MSDLNILERSILERIQHLREKCVHLESENVSLHATLEKLKQTLEEVNDRRKNEDVSQIRTELDSFSNQINDCLQIVNQLTKEYDGNE